MSVKIAVITPDRGDRPEFLEALRGMVERQARKPDEIIIANSPAVGAGIDIAVRYRAAIIEARKRGCHLCVCMENDDWYAPNYVEWMEKRWIESGKPDMLGINHTIYYNIITNRWVRLDHPGRSSMMNMAVTPGVLFAEWCAADYAYLDFHLWTKARANKSSIPGPEGLCVSIKHGIGLVGGGGHTAGWKHYTRTDEDWSALKGWIKDEKELEFYKQINRKQHENRTQD